MTTAWHHLPNAAHIDRIIADLKVNINNWNWAYSAAWDDARSAAWDDARSATYSEAREVAGVAAYSAARDRAWAAAGYAAREVDGVSAWHAASCAARSAIVALITWDDTGDYLDLSIDKVRVLAELGDKRAILMLPAVIAFERSKESV
jgi:hypothetical protein